MSIDDIINMAGSMSPDTAQRMRQEISGLMHDEFCRGMYAAEEVWRSKRDKSHKELFQSVCERVGDLEKVAGMRAVSTSAGPVPDTTFGGIPIVVDPHAPPGLMSIKLPAPSPAPVEASTVRTTQAASEVAGAGAGLCVCGHDRGSHLYVHDTDERDGPCVHIHRGSEATCTCSSFRLAVAPAPSPDADWRS